jgi:phospholipid/cholesterol/gamma-HCH transport system ATP-binding protein
MKSALRSIPLSISFVFAEADGPVPFHYPAIPLAQELLGKGAHGRR